MLRFTFLAPRILRSFLDFWKVFCTSVYEGKNTRLDLVLWCQISWNSLQKGFENPSS